VHDLGFWSLAVGIFAALLAAEETAAERLGEVRDARVDVAPTSDRAFAVPPKPSGLADAADRAGGSGTGPLTHARCAALGDAVRDRCWQALARQQAPADPSQALAICGEIAEAELALECRADVAEVTAGRDEDAASTICDAVASTKWRGQCHFGIGLALAERAPQAAMARCDRAEVFRDFCRHDVVGEAALQDVEAAVAICAREEGDVLARKTCWHGIGKYLARRAIAEAEAACARATPSWRSNCAHGAGWGAAERDATTALAACASWPEHADSCRQGVAHQLRRSEPERAQDIFTGIATESIRARCLDFVSRRDR
jgi:hypothetical protein